MNIQYENAIPAFSMWKMFYDTIPALFEIEFSEECVKRLTNIIKSDEFSNIFVYNYNPALSSTEYESIASKYDSFTVWLLGKFFYLLHCDKLWRIHNVIVDAQLRILHLLAASRPNLYNKLVVQHCIAMSHLLNALKHDPETQNELQVFVPEQHAELKNVLDLKPSPIMTSSKKELLSMLSKAVTFSDVLLPAGVSIYCVDQSVFESFRNLLHILKKSDVKLKLEAVEVLLKFVNHANNYSYISSYVDEFLFFFNRMVFQCCNSVGFSCDEKFENILLKFFERVNGYELEKSKIARTVFKSCVSDTCNTERRKRLQMACMKAMRNTDELIEVGKIASQVFENNNYTLLQLVKTKIIEEIRESYSNNDDVIRLDVGALSKHWATFIDLLRGNLNRNSCATNKCSLNQQLELLNETLVLVLEMKVALKLFRPNDDREFVFVDETAMFNIFLKKLEQHMKTCPSAGFDELYRTTLTNFLCTCSDFKFAHVLRLATHPHNSNSLDFITKSFPFVHKKLMQHKPSFKDVLQSVCSCVVTVSAGLSSVKFGLMELEQVYNASIKQASKNRVDDEVLIQVLQSIPHALAVFQNVSLLITSYVIPLFSAHCSQVVLKTFKNVLPTIVCMLSSKFAREVNWNADKRHVNVAVVCTDCKQLQDGKENSYVTPVRDKIDDSLALKITLINNMCKFYKPGIVEQDAHFINTLPTISNHLNQQTLDAFDVCFQLAGHKNAIIRQSFGKVIRVVVLNIHENKSLSLETRKRHLLKVHTVLKKFVKDSIRNADYDLQETLLDTLDELSRLTVHRLDLYVAQLLLFFIMMPNSKFWYLAINTFAEMGSTHHTKGSFSYTKYRSELCPKIVELSAINKTLTNSDLSTSLDNVSVLFGFHRTKDFVLHEGQHLLPYLVSLVVKMPELESLVRDMANLSQLSVSDLIAGKYGYIFLYVFLNETEEVFKKSMQYLERETGLKGQVLRKRHFRIILNELLLNFHDNRDRVLLALRLLAKEDPDARSNSQDIPTYLQPKFLGVLQYCDRKFVEKNSDKEKVFRSLVQIFKFMGPKCLVPLRFKIIAMLQTALNSNYDSYPEMSCDVWEAFIKSCDVESFGPQLALIVVSIMPLVQLLPARCNGIFRYLVVDNEVQLRSHLCDLFFLQEMAVDEDVLAVVRKYAHGPETSTLRDSLKFFLKYYYHEAVDVRVHGLKYIKRVLETNRKELDQLIFSHSGIDPVIVELLDVLTLGCRDKSDALKVVCGKVIGELGAIEPSRLPRRYALAKETFTFFITEDAFVTNILNELIKALQSEKNTQNMDRYALAMQEILKAYEVSPEPNTTRHQVWTQFPEAQQELMRPYLSSRYTIILQCEDTDFAAPIFGSKLGSNFQSWIYNWTCSLVRRMPDEKKSLLQLCLPCMKHDLRILMEFLPYVLLQSLLDCDAGDVAKAHLEISTVLESACKNKFEENFLQETLERTVVHKDSNMNECAKTVFILLDFLERWVREWEWRKDNAAKSNKSYVKVCEFVARFSKLQLAHCNYQCGEYPRALMYIEEYITENPAAVAENLAFLSQLYAKVDEPDGVTGVIALQQNEPSLNQRILTLEVSGKLAYAAACYERIQHPLKLYHLKGLIQCYLDLDNVNTALSFAQGAMDRQPEFTNTLLEMQAEPLWRLGKYDDLSCLLQKPELRGNESWGVQIGKALLCLRENKSVEFRDVLDNLRHQQVKLLAAASLEEGAYQHGYGCITKLHALNELEGIEAVTQKLLLENNGAENLLLKQLNSDWESRIKVVQESIRMTEPILCLRRVALEQAQYLLKDKRPNTLPKLNALLGESWLLSATNARSAGIYQQAFTYTLKAEKYAPPRLFLEKAKLHWLRDEQEHSLRTLIRGVESIVGGHEAQLAAELSAEQRKICAEAKLLIASYNDQTSNVDTETNILCYKEAVEVYKEWEKSLLYLGQFYDKVFGTYSDEDRDSVGSVLQIHMIHCFGKSLQYGSCYVYQSMPRILSIWFDYGKRLLDVTNSSVREERTTSLLKMTKLIDTFLERLPAYIFLTAFSQLISRIGHPQREVYIELKSIVIKLLLHYPQQVLWMMITVSKSSSAVRSKRCAEIFQDSRLKSSNMVKLVKDFTQLAEKLIELCNKEVPENVSTVTVSSLLRTLPRLLTKDDFSEVMMPTYKFRKLVLPNPDFANGQHNPFPNHLVHITGIEDEIAILSSLQRPRKITLRGSDGKKYIQMLKPKDDLRKDFRLMEFNDIVNQLLAHEAEARQRRLNIRLYSVAPLNEECGLIEWVPNLVGLRPVLVTLYKQKGMHMRAKEIKDQSCNLKDPLSKKRDIFTKIFLAKHPPVLGEWFRRTFPDAQSWLTARTAYIRTTAVMSMVGYILGLGDRHGENINLDSTNGDVVHVDFNCLFNKGETFEWPERVPFRLTNNMVGAMGPLGTEGAFRKSCSCTLRVLRTNTNTLMSIVTPFAYDPLVSWTRSMPAVSNVHNAERTNEQALEHVRNIEHRLQGLVKTKSSRNFTTPLSVDGQANKLIKEATNVDNLCQMYIGWGPYL